MATVKYKIRKPMRRYPASEITDIANTLFTKYVTAHGLPNTIKVFHKAGKLARAERVRREKLEPKKKRARKKKRVIPMP